MAEKVFIQTHTSYENQNHKAKIVSAKSVIIKGQNHCHVKKTKDLTTSIVTIFFSYCKINLFGQQLSIKAFGTA